jgi:RNA polymerase primary sigma factor
VAVYEQTPDAETLLLNNNVATAATEAEAEEEAEAALSTVDSEFGRTTDPVRMYMREMGTVELLTREGEIEIAKRIEGGLMDMMEAISASPATIAEILRLGEDIREGKVVITTIVDGFSNPNEADDYVAEEDFDEFDAADDDDGKGGSKALTKKLEELKREALTRFDHLRELFEKVHKIYDKEGYGTPSYVKPKWTTYARKSANYAASLWTNAATHKKTLLQIFLAATSTATRWLRSCSISSGLRSRLRLASLGARSCLAIFHRCRICSKS